MQKILCIIFVVFLSHCEYQSNSGQGDPLENTGVGQLPQVPMINPNTAYVTEAVGIQDPEGRIQTGDLMIFYPDGGDAVTDGVVAMNIIRLDANTLQAEVPQGLVQGAYWVSVRADINALARFPDLAFTVVATPNLSFQNHVYPLIQTFCSSCHSGSRPAAGLDLSSQNNAYANMVDVASSQCSPMVFLVSPGDSSTSYLMNKLTGVDLCTGSSMPKGGSMTAQEIDTFRLWIDQGASNN